MAAASAIAFDDLNSRAESELRLASVLKTSNDLDESLNVYKSILALSQTSGDRPTPCCCLGRHREYLPMQQRNEESANSLTQAIASISSTSNPSLVARLCLEFGRLHIAQNIRCRS